VNGVQILIVIGAGIAIAGVTRRWGLVQPGIVIMVLACAASFIPRIPQLTLNSELILAIVVPPLLYSATRGASFSSFGQNLRAILSLGVVLVVLTTGVFGYLTWWLLPTLPLAAAFTLGAVLAPPDTVTIVGEGDKLGMPRRVKAILTGESLVNDATALTLFSVAAAAVDGAHTSVGFGIGKFFYAAFVGLAVGSALAGITLWIRDRLRGSTLETALVLLVPFTAYLLAEELRASGILAVVAAAFAISVNTTLDPKHQYPNAYRTRLQEEAFWPVVDFLLETFVFAYIGLQLRFVLHDLSKESDPGLVRTLVAAGVLLVVAIVWRVLAVAGLFGRWTMSQREQDRRLARDPRYKARYEEHRQRRNERQRGANQEPLGPPTTRESLLVGWTGMRGILTLAAAAAVPETIKSGAPFPGRNSIQAIALLVTLGTLLIQGSTLRWVIKLLKLDTTAERAEADQMRQRGIAAAIDAAPEPKTDDDFEKQRTAVSLATRDGTVDEDTARALVADIDKRQAASHTFG
jgi:monovalent cation/hydrogen antiporter